MHTQQNSNLKQLLFNCQQTATMLCISETTLERLMREGKISFIKIEDQPLFTKEDMLLFIENQRRAVNQRHNTTTIIEDEPQTHIALQSDTKIKEKRLLTVATVAKMLDMSAARVYELIRLKMLPCVHIGRQIRINPATLDEWINNGGLKLLEESNPRVNNCGNQKKRSHLK